MEEHDNLCQAGANLIVSQTFPGIKSPCQSLARHLHCKGVIHKPMEVGNL